MKRIVMDEEALLKQHLALWPAAKAPSGLKQRVLTHALLYPQHLPWRRRALAVLEASFTDWHYGLSYKCASLALCMIVGLASGANLSSYDSMDDISVLIENDLMGDI